MTATNAVDVDGQMMEIKPAISVSEELHIYKPLKVRAEVFIWNKMKQILLISYFKKTFLLYFIFASIFNP